MASPSQEPEDELQLVDHGGVRKEEGALPAKVIQEQVSRPLVRDREGRRCFHGGHIIAHYEMHCGYCSETFGLISSLVQAHENGDTPNF